MNTCIQGEPERRSTNTTFDDKTADPTIQFLRSVGKKPQAVLPPTYEDGPFPQAKATFFPLWMGNSGKCLPTYLASLQIGLF